MITDHNEAIRSKQMYPKHETLEHVHRFSNIVRLLVSNVYNCGFEDVVVATCKKRKGRWSKFSEGNNGRCTKP